MDNNSESDDILLNNNSDDLSQSLRSVTEKIPDNNINQNTHRRVKIPKPIVSDTPIPIKIDSNINNTNDLKKTLQLSINSRKDSIIKPIVEIKDSGLQKNTLKVNEIMICRGIYKRNPIKPGYEFFNNTDSLFCYTKISNTGPKQEIKHVWFFEDKEISSVVYNIKTSYNYRSWSRKTIYPKQVGNWRVDVVAGNGDVIGTRNFSVKSIIN